MALGFFWGFFVAAVCFSPNGVCEPFGHRPKHLCFFKTLVWLARNKEEKKKSNVCLFLEVLMQIFLSLFLFPFLPDTEIKQELFVAKNKFQNSGFPAQRRTRLLAATVDLCDKRLVLSH